VSARYPKAGDVVAQMELSRLVSNGGPRRWNPAEMRNAFSDSGSFVAVLDENGVVVEEDKDPSEAYEKAKSLSPTGTVVVDNNVWANDVIKNPPATTRKSLNVINKAVSSSRIEGLPISYDWGSLDPESRSYQRLLKDVRAALRDHGRKIYERLLKDAANLVHVTQRRGGVAEKFNPSWLREDLLRENDKLRKVLGDDDDDEGMRYDARGLSLLPHGASFRTPFSTSTDQGPSGSTFCISSTPECRLTCLVNTGQRALESGAFASSYIYSHLLRDMPLEFCINLFDRTIENFKGAYCEGHGRFIRLNVLSDLPWEIMVPGMMETCAEYSRERFMEDASQWSKTDSLMFYDYTKIPYRRGIENIYDITYSFSGSDESKENLFNIVEGDPRSARRAAVVFVKREREIAKETGSYYKLEPGAPLKGAGKYKPMTLFGLPVWNGDKTDIRALDPEDVKIVGLAYKVASYKVFAGKGELNNKGEAKKYSLLNVVDSDTIDAKLPRFLVRVHQPDPEGPLLVMATQDLPNRRLILPTF